MSGLKVFTFLAFTLLQTTSAFAEEEGVEILKLSENTWLHTSHYVYPSGLKLSSNGLVVKDGDELILIDTAWGELRTIELLKKIEQEIALSVTKAVVTHSHGDRVAGVDVLESAGVKVYSHPLTQKIAGGHGLPIPNNTFEALAQPGTSINFGSLQVLYPGPGHTIDNLMIWVPNDKVLFGGCAIRDGSATSLGNVSQADIGSWQQVIGFIGKHYSGAKYVIPGHGNPGKMDLVTHTSNLLEALK